MLKVNSVKEDRFLKQLEKFKEAGALTKRDEALSFLSNVDQLSREEDGFKFLFEHISDLIEAGIFEGTPWEEEDKLVPYLVGGTLKSGHPNSSYEILSELRVLAILKNELNSSTLSQDEAEDYLESVIVLNLDLIFQKLSESDREKISESELNKLNTFFEFLISKLDFENIKEKLAEEVALISAQRPIVTRTIREVLALVEKKISTDGDTEADRILSQYLKAVNYPSDLSFEVETIENYRVALTKLDERTLKDEASTLSRRMNDTGLVSGQLAELVMFVNQNNKDLLPEVLGLNDVGTFEYERHSDLVSLLIERSVAPYSLQCIYGLSKMLKRSLLSRRAVKNGLKQLLHLKLEPAIINKIKKSEPDFPEADAHKLMIGGTLGVLGLPLGIGQGLNPTCQSARGISLWSEHAPAKLLNMIISAAGQDDLEMRFEGKVLKASELAKGLAQQFDYSLDPVSIILVPHLDKIYNEMMKRATFREDDPHKYVNPAFYGYWIQTGFASVYNQMTQSITDFDGFMRTFLASFHLNFNDDQPMVYPNPVGIFVTSAKGEMVGFHAISLLRVAQDQNDEMRAYFLNPNNEGRQNWGQGIKPSVYGNGERAGESSLPIEQFAARLYAFHYNAIGIEERLLNVDQKVIDRVRDLAKDSWGKKYIWL